METQPEIQQRIAHQRIQHIVDSYSLTDNQTEAFETYLSELTQQYPLGLIELALVQTLVKNWLSVPMKKGVSFLVAAQEQLNQWQRQAKETRIQSTLTPSQFEQITGLDPTGAFISLMQPVPPIAPPAMPPGQPTQATTD
jgi:hypothetical protein